MRRKRAAPAPWPQRTKRARRATDPLVLENPRTSPLALTFRRAWTSRALRADALWLDVPVSASSSLASALREFTAQFGHGPPQDAVIGLHLEALGSLIYLAAGSNWTDADGSTDATNTRENADASMLTAMSMLELFPGTDRQWSEYLVALVEANMVVLELRPLEQAPPRSKAPMKRAGDEWRLRVGVNWRRYMDQRTWYLDSSLSSWVALRQSMREVMLWTLMKSQDGVGQWTYPYPKELAVLCRAVGSDQETCTTPPATFDVGDMYARIDTKRQLQRDTSTLVSDERLLPTLRPYQKSALSWMLEREHCAQPRSPAVASSIVSCVRFEERPGVQYDPFHASFSADGCANNGAGDPAPAEFALSRVCGGILADEMGLGKTVEVIALVLSHERGRREPEMTSEHAPKASNGHSMTKEVAMNCICGSSVEHALGWTKCDYCGSLHHRVCTGYDRTRGGFVFSLPGTRDQETWVPCGSFMCFVCQAERRPELESKATLIVCPEAIETQWESELRRHVKPGLLSVLHYTGVKAISRRLACSKTQKPSAEWQVLGTAYYTSSCDVVLTTYEALGSDFHHLPSESGTQRRQSTRRAVKKYPFVASPLLYSTFWRVCMDEAQLGVENARLSLGVTVAQLRAVNTWVVTGTPFSTSITDLYGTLRFLRVAPFADDENGPAFFKAAVETCFAGGATERVVDLLLWNGQYDANGQRLTTGGGLLWRTTKRDVLDQLHVPAQHSDVVWCRFSRVERHFYETLAAEILARVRSDDVDNGNTLDVKLWRKLLELRQLCCHPGVTSTLSRANVRTVDDLLANMRRNALERYTSSQRQFIKQQNTLAAIHAIGKDHMRATVLYLDSYDVFHADASVTQRQDRLVLLNTLVNLSDAVRCLLGQPVCASMASRLVDGDLSNGRVRGSRGHAPRLEAIRSALADDCWISHPNFADVCADVVALERYAADIRSLHMRETTSKCNDMLAKARTSLESTKPFFSDAIRSIGSPASEPAPWWKEVLIEAERSGGVLAVELADAVRDALEATDKSWNIQFARSFQSVNGLRRAITDEWGALATQFSVIQLTLLAKCKSKLTEAEMAGPRRCCSYRYSYYHATPQSVCGICALELKVVRFHSQATGQRVDAEESEAREYELSGAPLALLDVFEALACASEKLCLLTMEKREEVMALETSKWNVIRDGLCLARSLLEARREHVQLLRTVVHAVRRVFLGKTSTQSSSRLPHRYDYASLTLEAGDVKHSIKQLEKQIPLDRKGFQDLRGKWRFIESLADQRRKEQQQQRPRREECVVCWQEMKPERIMLPCAHSFCHACVYSVASTSARCPMCRSCFRIQDVTLVCPDEKTLKQDAQVEYGCKVDALVGRVMALARGEPRVKCLLFSQWQSMLKMVTDVLTERGVKCFVFTTRRELPKTLDAFKTFAGDAASVLALPYRHGANGLNLMEATHVLLAEPPLNAAIEKQAISRVHRIGQTRETVVHRFVVRESIEERIYRSRRVSIDPRGASSSQRACDYKTSTKEENGEERISVNEVRAMLLSPAWVDEEEEKTEERGEPHPLWTNRVAVSA